MVAANDFITIPYTADMTRAGIKYACESLQQSYFHQRGDHHKRLRKIVAEKAAILAFTRHLNKINLPYHFRSYTSFSDPSHYDITIGGRRCEIRSSQFFPRKLIRSIHKKPHQLLQAQACLPRDQFENMNKTGKDILIFAFLTSLITPNISTVKKAVSAGQPIFLLHIMPKKWAYPDQWQTLGELVVETNNPNLISLEISGQDKYRRVETEYLTLKSKTPAIIHDHFYSIQYFGTTSLPEETIAVHSASFQETSRIKPTAWKNIWVYGMQIFFCGYITRDEFWEKATLLPGGSRAFQYVITTTENFSIPIQDLHPLNDLFERAKDWPRSQ